jgi:hypothetical protein
MNQPFQTELLSAYIDGRLSPEQVAAVDEHLASHPLDRQILDDMRRVRNELRGLPSLAPSPGLHQAIVAKLRTVEPAAAARRSAAEFSRGNLGWLIACAASLVGLISFGVIAAVKRNAGQQLAARSEIKSDESEAIAGGSPSAEASVAADEKSDADSGGGRGWSAANAQPDRPREAGDFAQNLQAAGGKDQPGFPDVARQEKRAQADHAAVSDSIHETPDLAVEQAEKAIGGAGGAIGLRDAMPGDVAGGMKDEAGAEAGLVVAPSPLDSAPHSPAEACTSFDLLVVVQVPADQIADDWVASVFQTANVQVDSSGPKSFEESLEARERAKKAVALSADSDRAGLAGDSESNRPAAPPADDRAKGEAGSDLKFAYLSSSTLAYAIDADVQHVRKILERLEGVPTVGFTNPLRWLPTYPTESSADKPDAFPASPAIARRLEASVDFPSRAAPPAEKSGAPPGGGQRVTQADGVIATLGLRDADPGARQRVLFVFNAAGAKPPALEVPGTARSDGDR